MTIPFGFCQCGCGARTTISDRTRPSHGTVKGQPIRFIKGHSSKALQQHKPSPDAHLAPGYGLCQCGCGQKTKLARASNSARGDINGEPLRFIKGHKVGLYQLKQTEERRKQEPDYGLCKCGCGQKTPLAPQSSVARGVLRGHPVGFVRGHQSGGKTAHAAGEPVTKMYKEGRSLADIGAAFNVSNTSVRNKLLKAGVKIRDTGGAPVTPEERSRLFWLRVDKNGPTPQSRYFSKHPISEGWEYNETTGLYDWVAGPCWLWTGLLRSTGYGEFTHGGVLAHRYAYCDFHKLDIKTLNGWDLIHGCDTPACVNPKHVNPANAQQNFMDRANKGRARHSEETKRKIGRANAIALRGRKATQEARANQSAGIKKAHADGKFDNRKPNPPRRPDIDTQQLITLYAQGAGSTTLSERFNISPSSIIRRLAQAGVRIRPLGTNQSKQQAGYGTMLCEMLVLCLCLLILASQSMPSIIQMGKNQAASDARARVLQFANIQVQLALCAAQTGCTPPVGLSAAVSAYTSGVPVVQGSYNYTWTNLGGGLWTYVASPGQSIFAGTQSFMTDQTGIISCNPGTGWQPC